jgi:uncharacterized protein
MKRWLTVFFLVAIVAGSAYGQERVSYVDADFPQYVGYVNDFAGLLSPPEKMEMEVKLRVYKEQTLIELVVITVNSLEGYPIEDYTLDDPEIHIPFSEFR